MKKITKKHLLGIEKLIEKHFNGKMKISIEQQSSQYQFDVEIFFGPENENYKHIYLIAIDGNEIKFYNDDEDEIIIHNIDYTAASFSAEEIKKLKTNQRSGNAKSAGQMTENELYESASEAIFALVKKYYNDATIRSTWTNGSHRQACIGFGGKCIEHSYNSKYLLLINPGNPVMLLYVFSARTHINISNLEKILKECRMFDILDK